MRTLSSASTSRRGIARRVGLVAGSIALQAAMPIVARTATPAFASSYSCTSNPITANTPTRQNNGTYSLLTGTGSVSCPQAFSLAITTCVQERNYYFTHQDIGCQNNAYGGSPSNPVPGTAYTNSGPVACQAGTNTYRTSVRINATFPDGTTSQQEVVSYEVSYSC